MFDVDKIKEWVVEKPVLIFFDSKKGFVDFCNFFLINYLNRRNYDLEYLLSIWEEHYGDDSRHPNNCAIELTVIGEFGPNWGHCWREWFEEDKRYMSWQIIHYTEFMYRPIEIDKDNLMDFLNK